MTPNIFTIVLFVILSIIVIILNKKSIDRHYDNANKISTNKQMGISLQDKCDLITKDVTTKHSSVLQNLTSIKYDIETNKMKAESAEEDLENRLLSLKKETDNNIEDLHNKVISELENKIEILTTILSALDEDNRQLRDELNEQKKKLNYYLNIDEAAENLTVNEDQEERERLLRLAKEQIKRQKSGNLTTEDLDESKTKQPEAQDEKISAVTQTISEDTRTYTDNIGGSLLDAEQEFARNYMDTTNENVFITGKAGTGKSFLLEVFRDTTDKSHVILAPTGIAALNVDGATLHSAFGFSNLVSLDVDNISDNTIKLKSEKKDVLKNVKTIIIDEISMVRADTFDKIDRILRVINKTEKPFGGKQMLIFGDLFQLPPVTKAKEYDYLMDKYGGIFFFNSDAYKTGNFQFIELTQNHRQKGDQAYYEILNRIREGHSTTEDIALLNTRFTPNVEEYDRFISLFPRKEDAERVNREYINQLETREYVYDAKTILDKDPTKTRNFESVFPISSELRLKVGTQVMMVANDLEHRWVNGTVGIIKNLSPDNISVAFGENRVYDVKPYTFEEQEIKYENGKITYEPVFSVMQYPIVPAYAITIHKSQGQTYQKIACDIEQCFASGQAYVALSRCASLNGLHLKRKITPASIKVDYKVLDFYRTQITQNLLQ